MSRWRTTAASEPERFVWLDGEPYPVLTGGTGAEIAVIAIAAVGLAVSTYSAYAQAEQQNTIAKSQAKAAESQNIAIAQANEFNAQVARNQAQQARDAAGIQADELATRNRHELARERALAGGLGVDTSGSPLLVLMDSAEQAALEESRVRYGGEVQATGFESQATLSDFDARVARSRRGFAFQSSPALNAGATLLTGATDTAFRFASLRRTPTTAGPAFNGSVPYGGIFGGASGT